MELIKSFFRKKKTKIYTMIFALVIMGLICMYSFINYYDTLVNDYYDTNLVVSFAIKKDYSENLSDNKYIKSIKKGVVLQPDFTYKTLKSTGVDSSENESSDSNNYIISDIFWDTFLLNESYTALFDAKDYQIEMNDDEIILAFPQATLNSAQEKTIKKIIGKKIGLISSNNKKNELIIKEVIDTPIAALLVSSEKLKEIEMENELSFYRVTLTDYKQADNVREELMTLDYDHEFNVIKRSYDYSEMQGLMSLISFLKIGGIIGVVFLFIIFVIICNNILKDERRNIYVERLVGYNKVQVSKTLLINTCLLIAISTIFTVVISIILLFGLNVMFKLKIVLFDFHLVLTMLITILLVSLVELFLFSIKINKCLKKDSIKF